MSKAPAKTRPMPKSKARGRPSLDPSGTTQVALRFPNKLLGIIEEHLAERLDGTDRAGLIRELVVDGLKHRGWIDDRR